MDVDLTAEDIDLPVRFETCADVESGFAGTA